MYYFTDSDKAYWENKALQNQQMMQPPEEILGGSIPSISGGIDLSPEQIQQINAIREQQAQMPSPLSGDRSQNNFIQNAGQDLADIVTGATSLITHPVENVIKPLGNEAKSIYNTYQNEGALAAGSKAVNDTLDFLIANYGITMDDVYAAMRGDKKASEVINTALKNAKERPVMTALDAASLILPAGKLLKGTKGVSKAGAIAERSAKLSPAQKIANTLNINNAEIGGSANKFLDKSEKVKKANYSEAQKKEAIKAHLIGEERPDLPKELLKDVGESINSYDEMLTKSNKYAETLSKEDKFFIADAQTTQVKESEMLNKVAEPSEYIKQAAADGEKIAQDMVREWELSKTTRSFDEIKRERQPYYDLIKNEGFETLENLAKEGDLIAQDIIKNKAQFDKGYLKIVPMAEITDIDKSGMINREGRTFAGKASDRMYGTATVDQIYDTYFSSPEKWIHNKVVNDIERTAIGEIATKGTLGGVDLVTSKTKGVKYINPNSTSIESMVSKATDIADNVNTVAIDKELLGQLGKQFENMSKGSNPFAQGSLLADTYNIAKSNALISGGYLAGNAQTALYNAMINSGLNPLTLGKRFLEAFRSNSELAKQIGTYRHLTKMGDRIKNPVLRGVNKVTGGEAVSNMMNYFDTKIQNTAVEMALHEALDKQGIKFEARAKALKDMDKLKLAELIDQVKDVALMNKTNTLLPSQLGKAWAMTNPFWRWSDTAIQSTYRMLKEHPIATNIVWNKAMGNLMFDQEMQRRAEIGVESDKPFVSFRYNPQTKTIQEVSAEFMPMMNTVKLFGETATAISKGDTSGAFSKLGFAAIPMVTAVKNAIDGKDQFGRPILNAKADRRQMYSKYGSGERYIMTPQGWQRVQGGTGEEILGTTLNQFVGINRFANRTLLPALTGVANLLDGGDRVYYQPYQYQFLGELGRAGVTPEGANPRRASSGMNSFDQLMGRYAKEYDPKYEDYANRPISAKERVEILKGMTRRDLRTKDMLLNRGGGI